MQLSTKNSATSEKIVLSAAQLFARQGYHGTSTRDIARLAGVSENTLFRHFDRKEDLFWSALRWHSSALKMRRDLLEGIAQGQAPEVVLPKILEMMADLVSYRPELLRLIAVAFVEPVSYTHLVEEGAEAGRVSVWGEAHDLVFVGVEVEAKVEGDERVQDSDGVVSADGADLFHLTVVEFVDAEAFDLTHGIVDDDEALIPARGVSRAGGMGQMVTDGKDLAFGKAGEIAADLSKQGFAGEDLAI